MIAQPRCEHAAHVAFFDDRLDRRRNPRVLRRLTALQVGDEPTGEVRFDFVAIGDPPGDAFAMDHAGQGNARRRTKRAERHRLAKDAQAEGFHRDHALIVRLAAEKLLARDDIAQHLARVTVGGCRVQIGARPT